MNKPKILCIVPARKGSIGLPNKNIKKLAGKPLIEWTLDTAVKSRLISKIVVSSDSEKVIKICKKKKYTHKIDVPFKRPKNISGNKSPISKTIIHVLNYYKKNKMEFDYFILLEPTSPIRFRYDVDNAINKFLKKARYYDSIVSIGEIKISPFLFKYEYRNKIKNLFNLKKNNLNRQNFKKVYFPFGVIYLSKVNTYLKYKNFYNRKTMFYKIKTSQCYEIDDIYDFMCVQTVIKKIGKL